MNTEQQKSKMSTGLVTKVLTMGILSLLCALSSPASCAGDVQKGMSYAAWEKNALLSRNSDSSLKKLSSTGADHIAITVTLYQDEVDSLEIKSTWQTSSDESIEHAARKARELGLKIMLKPHVDILSAGQKMDGFWRADIGFHDESEWDTWFSGYRRHMLHYAEMAERLNAEMFCVGTELSFASQKEKRWRDLISGVRRIYSGKLVYAANWDNYRNVKFWDDLDYVGIDAYFPLSSRPDPSVSQLIRGWEKWKQEILSFYRKVNKPIIFTEIGYTSTPDAPVHPWEDPGNETAGPKTQAKCYTAFFKTIWGCSWLAGVYWWRWDTDPRAGGMKDRKFTPQNKPARDILENYYKRGPGSTS